MARVSWIDKVIAELEGDPRKDEKSRRKLRENLQAVYADILQVMNKIEVEGKNLPYGGLKNELEGLMNAHRRHADVVGKILNELGGQALKQEEAAETYYPKGNFREILDSETALHGKLIDEANSAEDYGYIKVAQKLREVKEETSQLIEQIERILMRMNAEI